MMKPTTTITTNAASLLVVFLALLNITTTHAQNVTVPATCEGNTTAGTDEVIYTVPYPYASVLGVIGSYKNLTWSGNPDDTVTLNGSDNTVGTARTYTLGGSLVIETILVYDSPPGGPYDEVHNTALLYAPAFNVSLYIPYDGTVVQSVCDGAATQFNFTADFCADNVTAAAAALHYLHSMDAMTVGQFLGGMNFSSCAALGSGGSAGNASSTTSGSAPVSTFTGGATRFVAGNWLIGFLMCLVMLLV